MSRKQPRTRIAVAFGFALFALAAVASTTSRTDDTKERAMAITGEPYSTKIEPNQSVREAVLSAGKQDAKTDIRLTLIEVIAPAEREQLEGIRVFLNKPDATTETPTKDAHYVTSFTFGPATKGKPQDINLDLTRTVQELSQRGELVPDKPLTFTFVAVPRPMAKLPASFAVPLTRVAVVAIPIK